MSTSRASSAMRGIGQNDVAADARHYTTFALRELHRLMTESEDEKLRFACAKYLLEQAWGRPGLRPMVETAPPEDQETVVKLYALIDAAFTQKTGSMKKLPLPR